MANEAAITVTLANWEESKFKPRKDVEHPTWYKCSNRLLEDSDFYSFTHEEILVWYRILELVSQKQNATICLSYEHCERVCRLSRIAIDSAIEKLTQLKILIKSGPRTLRRRNVGVTSAAHRIEEKREEKNRIEKNRKEPPADSVFEALYQAYPRHEDKGEAFKRYRENIGPDQIGDFSKAVNHYAAVCAKRRSETKFIKQMASFIGSNRTSHPWTDLIERPRELDQQSASGRGPPAGALQREFNATDEFNEIMNEAMNDAG